MICTTHTDPQNGRVWLTYKADNWREWIIFPCHPDYVQDFRREHPFGWAYVSMRGKPWTLDREMIIAPVAIFIAIGRGVKNMWFSLGHIAYKAGFIAKPKDGVLLHWFWLRYLKSPWNK